MKRFAAGLTFCATLLVGGCGGPSDADGGGVADSSDGGSRTFNGIVVEAGANLLVRTCLAPICLAHIWWASIWQVQISRVPRCLMARSIHRLTNFYDSPESAIV